MFLHKKGILDAEKENPASNMPYAFLIKETLPEQRNKTVENFAYAALVHAINLSEAASLLVIFAFLAFLISRRK